MLPPSKISGGLYHNVVTWVVYAGTGTEYILARPKSDALKKTAYLQPGLNASGQ